MWRLILILSFLVASVGAQTLPTLPQATVDLTMPTQGGSACPTLTTGSNCIRTPAAGSAANFSSALAAATCGDTIVLAAGSTYTGNFTVPNEGACSGWIVVKSSATASLPASNNRVSGACSPDTVCPTPSGATIANMAKVTTTNGTAAITISDSAHNWRFIGLEITTSIGNTVSRLVSAGVGTAVLGNLPTRITFDHCYIHGDSTSIVTRGIYFNVAYGAVVDSDIREIHGPTLETQAITVTNGVGPYLYQNNFLSAGSENTIFGGGDPTITNLVAADITIVGNHYWKDYTNWLGAGLAVKNSMELKSAQRVLVDGNVFDYSWADGQTGNIVSFKSVDQDGSCNSCGSSDVTFTHNLVRHGAVGVVLTTDAPLNGGTVVPLNRVLVQNNVMTDISTTYGDVGDGMHTYSAIGFISDNETIDHNSIFANNALLVFGDSGTIPSYKYTNNIGTYGVLGVKGTGCGTGSPTLTCYVPTATWNDIAILTASGNPDGNTWPSGTFWNTTAGALFTNYAAANYQLQAGSAYHNAGTDGKDIGVWDWATFNRETTNALNGTFAALGTTFTPGMKATSGTSIK